MVKALELLIVGFAVLAAFGYALWHLVSPFIRKPEGRPSGCRSCDGCAKSCRWRE